MAPCIEDSAKANAFGMSLPISPWQPCKNLTSPCPTGGARPSQLASGNPSPRRGGPQNRTTDTWLPHGNPHGIELDGGFRNVSRPPLTWLAAITPERVSASQLEKSPGYR
jgi:hypothetical protein